MRGVPIENKREPGAGKRGGLRFRAREMKAEFRRRVLDHEAQPLGAGADIGRHGDPAARDDSEERDYVLDRVRHQEKNPLARRDPRGAEIERQRIDEVLQIGVGQNAVDRSQGGKAEILGCFREEQLAVEVVIRVRHDQVRKTSIEEYPGAVVGSRPNQLFVSSGAGSRAAGVIRCDSRRRTSSMSTREKISLRGLI